MSFKSAVDGGRQGFTVNSLRTCVLVLNRVFWLAAVSGTRFGSYLLQMTQHTLIKFVSYLDIYLEIEDEFQMRSKFHDERLV
jgi:hypothetical protein